MLNNNILAGVPFLKRGNRRQTHSLPLIHSQAIFVSGGVFVEFINEKQNSIDTVYFIKKNAKKDFHPGGNLENSNNMEKKTLSGYAIVFGSRSRVYRDKGIPCWDVVESGAISQYELNRMDVKCLIEGNTNKLLSRSIRGRNGSLKLSVDDIGLRFEFDVPNTEAGIYAYELVSRGDITGAGAKFSAKYKANKSGIFETRYINKIDNISSIFITSDPDFTKTSVKVACYSDRIKALREKI